MTRMLYVITCGSSSASRVYELITVAQQHGWEVCSIPVRLLDVYVGVHSLNLLQAGLRWLWH